jgi:phosphoribosylformylglycinamidine synthase
MSAYEIMLSESQERMLLVAHKGKEQIVKDIFTKWDLNVVEVGKVIAEDRIKISYKGKLEADIPADILVLGGGAPVYKRETKEPEYLKQTRILKTEEIKEPNDLNEVLIKLLESPNITNKRWVYEQYDTQVRTNTALMPGGDASVVRIKKTTKGLAMKTDCNSKYTYLNPYVGGMIAVCESARNVVCTGAKPLAITNCLNFGNPYNPEMYYQFVECVRGMGDACRHLDTPVTGGNVSFYNLSRDYAVFPTPTIGMVGLIEDVDKMMTSYFKNEGDTIIILGKDKYEIGGSEYLSRIHKQIKGNAPELSLEDEKKLCDSVLNLIDKGLINSAHDVADGGLAVAFAEACVMNREKQIGCEISIKVSGRNDFAMFSESQSRIIISCGKKSEKKVIEVLNKSGVDFEIAGVVKGNSLRINDFIDMNISRINESYFNTIQKIMENN